MITVETALKELFKFSNMKIILGLELGVDEFIKEVSKKSSLS